MIDGVTGNSVQSEIESISNLLSDDNKNPKLPEFIFGVDKIVRSIANMAGDDTDSRAFLIDGHWGCGKTFFVTALAKYYEQKQDAEAVVFDAFKHDHCADPLHPLILEIYNQLDRKSNTDKTLQESGKLNGALLKAMLRLVNVDVDKIFADYNSIGESDVDNIVTRYNGSLSILEEFKKELTALDGESYKLIIIDELDRCRPEFAILLLERIKYLFNEQGIVFLITMCKTAFKSIVNKFYGLAYDSNAYLQKFFLAEVSYPKCPDFYTRMISESSHGDNLSIVSEYVGFARLSREEIVSPRAIKRLYSIIKLFSFNQEIAAERNLYELCCCVKVFNHEGFAWLSSVTQREMSHSDDVDDYASKFFEKLQIQGLGDQTKFDLFKQEFYRLFIGAAELFIQQKTFRGHDVTGERGKIIKLWQDCAYPDKQVDLPIAPATNHEIYGLAMHYAKKIEIIIYCLKQLSLHSD